MFSSWCSCSIVIKFDLGVDSVKESSFELYWLIRVNLEKLKNIYLKFKRLFQKVFLSYIKKNMIFFIVNIAYIY
jgi:hypothetical protein